MKKKIFIVLGIIAFLFICLVGYYVVTDLQQESKLKDEILLIEELTNKEEINDTDLETLSNYLERTVTKDDYAKVEVAIKGYLKDSFDNILKIVELLNDERIVTVLTVENYREDGKDFVETKKYLEEYTTELEDSKNKYIEYFTEEKVMSYLDTNNLDDYYIDLYKNEYVGDLESALKDKTVENSVNSLLDTIGIMQQIIDLLSSNSDSWYVDDQYINFYDTDLSNEYDRLVEML